MSAGNLLYSAALSFKGLQWYEYEFILGRKGEQETLIIGFPTDSFHHLSGLHKIGLPRIKQRMYALDYVLNNDYRISEDDEERIRDRLNGIIQLKSMIENNSLIVKLRHGTLIGSGIVATHIMENDSYMGFIDGDFFKSIFVPRPDQIENARRCVRLTTLQINRRTKDDNKSITVYTNPAYRQDDEK